MKRPSTTYALPPLKVRGRLSPLSVCVFNLALCLEATAQLAAPSPSVSSRPALAEESAPDSSQEDELTVTGRRPTSKGLRDRARERLEAPELRERLSPSTPESLRGLMGVYVQQSAHGQASVFIRGRTGRHTLLMVDGFRLNHALFRQGPNQYLFTVDPLSVRSVEVLRGGGSVWLGANALSGAVLVHGHRPEGQRVTPPRLGLTSQYSSADQGLVARLESTWRPTERLGFYLAFGGVTRGELRASGALPADPSLPELLRLEKNVPRLRADGRTQMGTGYDALSGALITRYQAPKFDLNTGIRLFRQYNAPRTDQCPPPEAPEAWCLSYDEQFRTHAFSSATLKLRRPALRRLKLGLSYQRQHERRSYDRVQYLNTGRDAVNVWELRAEAETKRAQALSGQWALSYGADGTYELVASRAWDTLVRAQVTREASRGQYLDGSQYLRSGAWAGLRSRWRLSPDQALKLRLGARLSGARALAPGDVASESRAIDRSWLGASYGGGLTWSLGSALSVITNVEEGFATPNLDDLTARQLTGQGFQVENPSLSPERALTYELGLILRRWGARLEGWLFAMELSEGIERRDAECPASDLACQASRTSRPFTLINLPEPAWITGVEQRLTLELPAGFTLTERLSYARGEGPSPLSGEAGQRRPLSRVPPLNGGGLLRWAHSSGLYLGYELWWARAATRLSFGDELDSRIPFGGTPGYVVHRLLFGGRWPAQRLELLGVLDNLTDTPYRVHGSSVNGAMRGLNLSLRYTL